MRSVGVIGGLGPETTAEFYLEVIFGCQKIDDSERPLIVISSVPLITEIERELIATNKGKERYIPFLISEAKRLEKSGVDFLVMPCNSLHVFIEEIRNSVKIPVLSIVDETIAYLKKNKFQEIGLISTSATVENKVYENALAKNNIKFIAPNGLQRAKINKIIQRLIEGQHLNSDRNIIESVVKDMVDLKVNCVALACTDLQLLLPSSSEVNIFDTMKILADATIREIFA